MLHPTRHVLIKMMLHSNLPGEVNFGRTARIEWELVRDGTSTTTTTPGLDVDRDSLRREQQRSGGEDNGDGTRAGRCRCTEGYDAIVEFLSGGHRQQRAGSTDSTSKKGRGGSGGGDDGRNGEGGIEPSNEQRSTMNTTPFERPMVLDRAADHDEGGVRVKGKQTGELSPSIMSS